MTAIDTQGKAGFSARQRRLLLACFIAYTGAYISRTNLSPAMDAIGHAFGLSAAQAGILPTLFAVPYAVGQAVNGYLADRFDARGYILFGLLGSAAANLGFSLAGSYPALLGCWFLNGVFQSMIWTPVVRIIADDFSGAARSRAMFLMSVTLITGYLIAWALSGYLTHLFSWRTAFRASAGTTAVFALTAFAAMKGRSAGNTDTVRVERTPVKALLRSAPLLLMLLFAALNGYVRDSVMNWAPKMLMDTQGIDLSGAVGAALIIPVINFLGIQSGKALYGSRRYTLNGCMFVLLAAGAAITATMLPALSAGALVCALLLALVSASCSGINTLVTGIWPMSYAEAGRAAFAAGLVDAAVYAGSALSGFLTGMLRDGGGWPSVFLSWLATDLLSGAALYASSRAAHRAGG